MVRTFFQNPLFKFLFIAGFLLLSWNFLYDLYLKPNTQIDRYVIDNLISVSGFVLTSVGYELMPTPPAAQQIRTIGIDGSSGVWIGDPCNGIILFALFLVFMIAYPGPWKKKLWYIPLGLVIIHLVNIIRIIALTIIVTIDINWLEFNHNYTFYIFVYGAVFALWYYWAFKLSGTNLKISKEHEPAS
jgi:exosortase family protein XrtF